MTTFTDVFGNQTLPPAEYGYAAFTLTADATFVWPYNSDNATYTVAKVMNISCVAGNAVILPDAQQVSTGEDFLIRNVGSNTLIVKNAAGTQIATVASGAASYFYLTSNSTEAGVYGVIGFGVGTSSADASSLVGYGIKAVGASLNQSHPVFPTNNGMNIDDTYRAKLIVFNGGADTFTLSSAATLGDDYFTMFRNDGTGTATLDPYSTELIDGSSSMQVQPGESLILICTGTQWYSVGYGRSTLYQFTQLTKDVSAGGTITLTAAEAANKLITFIGNPAADLNVVIPNVVSVYYTHCMISTPHTITFKTSAGTGVGLPQGSRIIALCDGTNVVSAQSIVANTTVTLTDGSASIPALSFASQLNTGIYKYGTQDIGFAVNGSAVGRLTSTGFQGLTYNLANNTLTGTKAQFDAACSDGDFSYVSTSVQKDSSTGSAYMPVGTTAQRTGSPSAGYLRFNTDSVKFEAYNGSGWSKISGAEGGGTDSVFYENDTTVTTSYTITTNKNAMTAGPITINSGATVTVPTGSSWTVV